MIRGLIGEKLSHSYSVDIHTHLSSKPYEIKQLNADELKEFMIAKEFEGINVTIPYKQTVISYLTSMDKIAEKTNAVNTIVNRDGKLYGYNTDVYGFRFLIDHYKVEPTGKKVIVLGDGGAAQAIKQVFSEHQLRELVVVKRNVDIGCISYDECYLKHTDAEIIVNTSPVGMYPNTNASPIILDSFYQLESVIDIIYNPLKTKLLVRAEELGVKAIGGLMMLVAQAKKAVEIFDETKIADSEVVDYTKKLSNSKRNIVLIGMPGAGKSVILRNLKSFYDYKTIDVDDEIVKKANKSIPDLFAEIGEEGFRALEAKCIEEISKESHQIIACGGGVVKNRVNMELLKQNGYILFIDRSHELLPIDKGRPLSEDRNAIMKLYDERIGLYKKYSDVVVKNDGSIEEVVTKIREIIE